MFATLLLFATGAAAVAVTRTTTETYETDAAAWAMAGCAAAEPVGGERCRALAHKLLLPNLYTPVITEIPLRFEWSLDDIAGSFADVRRQCTLRADCVGFADGTGTTAGQLFMGRDGAQTVGAPAWARCGTDTYTCHAEIVTFRAAPGYVLGSGGGIAIDAVGTRVVDAATAEILAPTGGPVWREFADNASSVRLELLALDTAATVYVYGVYADGFPEEGRDREFAGHATGAVVVCVAFLALLGWHIWRLVRDLRRAQRKPWWATA
jgi:hypothetical protein